MYAHDTYGLGHLRRSLTLAGALGGLPEVASVLLVTGSPCPDAFPLPPNCDIVRLPAATKTPDGRYECRTLGISLPELVLMRGELVVAAERTFRPDLVLVDHAPVGMEGELWPLFRSLVGRHPRPALVLGLRDVIDEPARVEREWNRLGVWSALREVYDRVLVYGDPSVLTTAEELGLAGQLGGRMRYVGYLARECLPRQAHAGRPTILVTVGGGGDGALLLEAYAEFLSRWVGTTPFRSVVVTGPFISEDLAHRLLRRYTALGQPVEVKRLVGGLEETLAEAAGVVAMAGYNTVVEILSAGVPALLVPRTTPRREQAIRATRLAAVAGLEVFEADDRPVDRIDRFVQRVLAGEAEVRPSVRLNGLETTGAEIRTLLAAREASAKDRGPRRAADG